MRKTGPIIILLLCCATLLVAQPVTSVEKIGASLKTVLAQPVIDPLFAADNSGGNLISVQFETADPATCYTLAKKGYPIRTIMGAIATADLTPRMIYELSEHPSVKRIELPLLLRKTDTTMRRLSTVKQVLEGRSPLPGSYTGKGIVIGIIDDGFDISHPDFFDEKKQTRFQSIWSMRFSRNAPPEGFTYGHEWTADSINFYAQWFNRGITDIRQMQQYFGFSMHGTPVASIAAGNNGVATNATLVGVCVSPTKEDFLRSDKIIDGIAYIYGVARKQNKKCIINISLGIMDGAPHDGKSLLEKAIDAFCILHPDLLVCVAAGNNGNSFKHWGGFPIRADSSYGIFRNAGKSSMYFSIPKANRGTISIAVHESQLGDVAEPNTGSSAVFYKTGYIRVDSLIQMATPVTFTSRLPSGKLASYISLSAAPYNDDYDELVLTVDLRAGIQEASLYEHVYRYILKGTGTVHAWYPFANMHPLLLTSGDPLINDPSFHSTDNAYTTNIPSHAFTVLTSGAYNIRTCYVNIHNRVVQQYERCQTAYFTSHGPTQDGRVKPDVLSPGDNLLAARSRYDLYFGYENIIDTNTVMFGGTSAASPVTAGIAALLWEKFPDYTREQIVQQIIASARFDVFSAAMGPMPNTVAGWGKTDAFAALTGERLIIDNSCSASDKCSTQVVDPVDPALPVVDNTVMVFPNPVADVLHLQYTTSRQAQYAVFDVTGRLLFSGIMPASTSGNTVTLNCRSLASGVYFLKITGLEKTITRKIMVSGR